MLFREVLNQDTLTVTSLSSYNEMNDDMMKKMRWISSRNNMFIEVNIQPFCKMCLSIRYNHDLFSWQTFFEDVIGEPEGAHSAECVFRNSYRCFYFSKDLCYTILTYLCAIPLAFCWGCEYLHLNSIKSSSFELFRNCKRHC